MFPAVAVEGCSTFTRFGVGAAFTGTGAPVVGATPGRELVDESSP